MVAVTPGRTTIWSGSMETVLPSAFTVRSAMSPSPVTVVATSRFTLPTWAPAVMLRVEPVAFSSTVMVSTSPAATPMLDLGVRSTTSFTLPASFRLRPSSPSSSMRLRPQPAGVLSAM